MYSPEEVRPRHAQLRRVALTFWRALRSTLIVAVVAVVVSGLRDGGLQWTRLARAAAANRALFGMVFLGFLVWDFWFRRAKRRPTYDSLPGD